MKRIITIAAFFLLATAAAGAQENPIATISHDPGWCTIFHRWGFIGDSLCSGEHEYKREDGSTVWHDIYEYSWGQRIVAAIGGATGENYSVGGETAKGWIRNFWDYPMNRNRDVSAKARPKQVYIIALGCNDRKRFEPGDASKDVNKDDYTKNADTFIGNYAGIIQRVKTIQPKARFFVCTLPTLYPKPEFSEQIRKMPEMFDYVYLIDLEKYGPDFSDPEMKAKYFVGGHMNAAGYQLMAWIFMTYINHIVENNLKDFADIALVE